MMSIEAQMIEENNLEKFSNNPCPPKRGRGRPKKEILDQNGDQLTEPFIDREETFVSKRAHTEHIYQMRTFEVLISEDDSREFYWLFGGVSCRFKTTIMAALGRIENDEELREMARLICQMKPKTREALSIIRQHRRGAQPPDVSQLAQEILNTVNDYKIRYPALIEEEIREAFSIAKACL